MKFLINYQWLFWPVAFLYTVACGVWALMLVSAFVSTLPTPPSFLKSIALRREFADKIMKSMVRELITLIGAFGMLGVAMFQTISLSSSYEKQASTLLCQVRADGTPAAVSNSIKALEEIPGQFTQTLRAYGVFLENTTHPNFRLIENLLDEKKEKSVYDIWLLGLINHCRAVGMRSNKDFAGHDKYVKIAEDNYRVALDMVNKGKLPGTPELTAAAQFGYNIQQNLATISFSLGNCDIKRNGQLTQKAKELIEKSIKEFIPLLTSPGNMPATYTNLMAAYSIVGNYPEALNVLKMVSNDKTTLGDMTKQLIKNWISDLSPAGMDELLPLAAYVKKTKGIDWKTFVDGEFQNR